MKGGLHFASMRFLRHEGFEVVRVEGCLKTCGVHAFKV